MNSRTVLQGCLILFLLGLTVRAGEKLPVIETHPHDLDCLIESGHIQGACCSEKGFYLSHQLGIDSFDWNGVHKKHITVPAHLGDIAYADGKIFGAFALRGKEIRKKYGSKGLIRVWNEDLDPLYERAVDDSLGCALVVGDTLYAGPDRFGKVAHSNCCIRTFDLNLNPKEEKTLQLGYSVVYGVQTMGTDGKEIILGHYGGSSRVTFDLKMIGTLRKHSGLCLSEGFGLVPKSVSRREIPVFFTVNAMGGNMHGWRADPKKNPPRIQIRFYEYSEGLFKDITDYR